MEQLDFHGSIPCRLKQRLFPTTSVLVSDVSDQSTPLGRGLLALPSSEYVLYLFDGMLDGEAPSEIFRRIHGDGGFDVFGMDLKRGGPMDNILDDEVYTCFLYQAMVGTMVGLAGGPNCRSWSILLQRLKTVKRGVWCVG